MAKPSANLRAKYAIAELREALREIFPEIEFHIVPSWKRECDMQAILERDIRLLFELSDTLRDGLRDLREEEKRAMN
jgi:hypothetical protein